VIPVRVGRGYRWVFKEQYLTVATYDQQALCRGPPLVFPFRQTGRGGGCYK
jgi:hypothetical protein